MLFSEKVLFIHVPKTAGSSVKSCLIRNLEGPLTYITHSRPLSAADTSVGAQLDLALRKIRYEISFRLRPRIRRIRGRPHANLIEASRALAQFGRKLDDFEVVLAVIRNPYDLEVSRFHYLGPGDSRVPGPAHAGTERHPLAGDFAAFVERLPRRRIETWFEIDGRTPANLRILRFETLEQDLHRALEPFCRKLYPLPRLNASVHAPYVQYLSPEVEEVIYRKYRWAFDRGYYRRELNPPK